MAARCGLARSTMREHERRSLPAGSSWLRLDVDAEVLENCMVPAALSVAATACRAPETDWLEQELRHRGSTRCVSTTAPFHRHRSIRRVTGRAKCMF